MRCWKGLLGILVLSSLPAVASAQTNKFLTKQGDTVIGLGIVDSMSNVAINDAGTWLDLVDTNHGNEDADGCLLRNGFVTVRESGMVYDLTATSVVDEFKYFDLTPTGNLAMILTVRRPTASEGLYWNTIPVAIKTINFVPENPLSTPRIGANSQWIFFNIVKMNASNTMMVVGQFDNKAVGAANSREDILYRYQLDSTGNILSQTVLATRDTPLAALGNAKVTTINQAPHTLAMNKHGDFVAVMSFGSTAAYIRNMDTVLAIETGESPVPGRLWRLGGITITAKSTINDFGEYALTGSLEGAGDNYLLAKNGQKFVQQGDFLPLFSTNPIGQGSQGPVYIANTGDVFWWAQDSAGTGNAAFMRNHEPIVQASRTVINGLLCTEAKNEVTAFAISPSGRFWVGRARVQLIGDVMVYIDFGLVVKMPGCEGNPGELKATGKVLPGQAMQLAMDKGQAPGVTPLLVFSQQERNPGSDCGVHTRFGEVLTSGQHRVASVFLPTWDGTNPSTFDFSWPNDVSLVNAKFFAQGVFWDVGNASPAPNFRLTNGLRFEVGAP